VNYRAAIIESPTTSPDHRSRDAKEGMSPDLRGEHMRAAVLCAIAISVLIGCSPNRERGSVAPDYTIYSVVINGLLLANSESGDKQSGYVYIKGTTTIDPHLIVDRVVYTNEDIWAIALRNIDKNLPGISKETLDDFKAANEKPSQLEKRLELKVAYRFMQDHDNWDVVSNPSSFGRITVSKIGYNHLGNEALVYVDILKMDKDGWGCVVLLCKQGNNWIVKQKRELWRA
jgi:hypothetical protein